MKKKRLQKSIITFVLAAAMVTGALPLPNITMVARAAEVTEIEIASWEALKGNSNAATVTTADGVTTITLNSCIKLTAKLAIASGEASEQPYVLDLNGYGIRYAGTNDDSVIEPVWKCSSLTLKDSNPSSATYYIALTDGRGTAVSNSAPSGTEGTDYLAVTGGYITGGKASSSGGGVCCSSFTMEGGTICGNKAGSDGGVAANNFTMSGGAISYNSATSETGGMSISNNGTALMTGGTIAHNSGPSTDVYNYSGTFVMTGGTIGYAGQSGNSVNNTGHFYLKSGSTLYGTVDCNAAQTLHTVTVGSLTNGRITVSDPAWTDNTTQYYASGDTVTLTITPDTGYEFGTITVTKASGGTVEVSGTGNTRTFTMTAEDVTVSATFTQPVAQVGTTKYPTLQDAINNAQSGGTVTLLRDVTTDRALVVRKTVTLDLAGHTIDRGLAGKDAAENGYVIEVQGDLTLTDGSAEKTGKITGGNDANGFGGGVYVNGGTFTMQGGTITVNNVTGAGGGVYVAGDSIKSGTFTMTGGTITGNNATGFGGGVCVSEGCTFNVSGSPVISANWTEGKWEADSARYICDEDNYYSAADDVLLSATDTNRTYITVTGALTSGASIYVNKNVEAGIAFAQADAYYTIGENDAACFHSDAGESLAGVLEGNKVMFKKSLTEDMIGAIASQTYTGSAITPEPVVTDGETLTKGTDYTVSYSNNVNAAASTAESAPTVTVTGKGSYTGTVSKTFTINKKSVTVSGLTASDKDYDGNTTATLVTTGATFTGKVEVDTLTVSGSGAFADAGAGDGKTVNINISNLTLGGASKDNYELAGSGNQTTTTAKINKKKLTITGVTVQDKEYDGNTTATTNCKSVSISGLVGSETVTVGVTGTFESAAKGNNKTVNLSGWTLSGTNANNYEVDATNSQQTTTADITGIQVYISGVAASNKTYDGTNTATVTGTAVLKKVNGDAAEVSGLTVSNITAAFADKNVGTGKSVTITGGTLSDSTNYTLVTSATTDLTANITAKPVTITGLSAENKVYDGNTTATVKGTAVIDGKVSGDTVTVTAGSAAFADKNADDGKTVTFSGYSLSDTDAGNYTLSAQPASVTANITKASLTVTAKPLTISYGDEPAGGGITYSGFVDGETSSVLGGALTYDYNYSQYGDVGGYTITPSGLTSDNYEISFVAGTLTVEQKEVGLTWSTTPLTFNGSAQAPTAGATELVNGDTVSVTVTGAQTDAETGYTATASELTGAKAGNYKLPDANTTTFSIGKAGAQTLSDITQNKSYQITEVTASVAGKMSANAGTLSYAKGEAGKTGSVTISNWSVDSSTGAVTATISGGAKNDTITLPVIISSTNYADSTVNVKITLVDKTEAAVTIAGDDTKTYGDTGFSLSAQAADIGTGTGVWSWTSSNEDVATITDEGTVTIISAGTATITASYESDTTIGSATLLLTVNPKSVAIPTAATGLKWTGSELTGVSAGTGYTVTGEKGTDVGNYTATATLTSTTNYIWSDGTTEAKEISWSIGKANGPAAPIGLSGIPPTSTGGSDGKIKGVTDRMEYSTKADFSTATPCSGSEITGLSAGTYYVRVKETTTSEAGAYATVTIAAKSSGGSGGTGGGGGGTTPSKPDDPTPDPTPGTETYTIPVTNDTSVPVDTKITDGNAVVSEITAKDIEKITGSTSGEGKTADTITIDLSGAKQNVDSVELTKGTVEALGKALTDTANNVETVTIKMTDAIVELDASALEAIAKQSGGKTAKLSVDKGYEKSALNKKQQEAIGDYKEAVIFEAYLESDGTRIHDLNGGTAKVSMQYDLPEGLSSQSVRMLYLDPTGNVERLLTTYEDGWATGILTHCSEYAIVYDESGTADDQGAVEMHRLYNPNSGEHFYTGNIAEKDHLIEVGWSYEGVAWTSPESSEIPVYRLYNPNAGDHHYTTDVAERDYLIEVGWSDEGIGWYSEESKTVQVFRLYNPNALLAGAHHFTVDEKERDHLVELGWKDEGIGWYGMYME